MYRARGTGLRCTTKLGNQIRTVVSALALGVQDRGNQIRTVVSALALRV